ncbi:MAG: DNA repair exonuclease [Patescibacteria group bacterium]|nr:DNA repair exonuclease [Patescibacteria group bacterium]
MKIIHTADIHLNKPNDERYQALEFILKECSVDRYNIDLLTISGDLYDNKKDIFNLKRALKELFEKYLEKDSIFKPKFTVLIIPGNHDEDLYDAKDYLGRNVELLCGNDVCIKDFEDVRIVGVPFFKGDFDSVISDLEDARVDSKINILMVHCTLDFPEFNKGGFGDEGKYRYLPISTEQLVYLDYDYVLAGHFHSKFIEKPYQKSPDSKKNWFINPGSPVKVTNNERGKRKLCLIDTEEKLIKPIILDTFYYDSCQITFHPYKMNEGFKQLENFVNIVRKDWDKKIVEVEIDINGYISIPEVKFKEKIDKICEGMKYNNKTLQVIELMNKPLFKRFKELLEQKELENYKKDQILNFVVEAFKNY